MVIHQWLPSAADGDAVGNTARRYRDCLREMGHDSDIFALEIADEVRHEVRPFADARRRRADATLLHFATPSPMSAALGAQPGARLLQYHNITPARYFAPFDQGLARLSAEASRELAGLVGRLDLALGASEFNRRELAALGFDPTDVLPLPVETGWIASSPATPAIDAWLRDGALNFLFVGRVVPNKRIEDLLRLAEAYGRLTRRRFRLIIVGRYDGAPGYYLGLREMIAAFGWPADRCVFTGAVPERELAAYYRAARVYVSMSEHEGFGVPLIEAMAAGVPVLAYAAAAVPDTLGGAGVQFTHKDFERTAVLLDLLASDRDLRASITDGQRRRLAQFDAGRTREALRGLVGRYQ